MFKVGDLVKRKNGSVVYQILSIKKNGALNVIAVRYRNYTVLTPFSAVKVEN